MKKTIKKSFCVLLAGMIVFVSSACSMQTKGDASLLPNSDTYKVYASDFTQVDAKGQKKGKHIRKWRDGFVTGNGENGVVNAGSPYDDTLIYQNINFVMPCETIREAPDISNELDNVRQTIVDGNDYMTENDWYTMYCFHPAGQLRLSQEKSSIKDYIRWCDYDTGEVGVKYTDKNGTWQRNTFTSRVDNATITKISESSNGEKINMTLSFDDISKMYNYGDNAETGMKYKKIVDENATYLAEIAHYPSYDGSELKNAGYATVTYVVAVDGTKKRVVQADSEDSINVGEEKNPAIEISDATEVYLITISDRDMNMGVFSDFENQESYPLIENLLSSCKEIETKYTDTSFNYDKALEPSKTEQSELFSAVTINLNGEDNNVSNEELLSYQHKKDTLNSSLVERVYNAGRYAMICCSGGNLISRLYGMWTGEWGARWNGAYTMDANVNLQCSGMNTSHTKSYGESYIKFVMNQLDDWKTNAKKNYGFDDAIQVPCNTDGNSAISVEYNSTYAFEYWNNGAAWMITPIYEYYLCYGNEKIMTDDGEKDLLSDILLPLLTYQANFWEQLLTPEYYTDSNGDIHYKKGKTSLNDNEYYCILPTYSPENMPSNKESAITANSTVDISAAKSGMEMIKNIESVLGITGNTEKWNAIEEKLPPYLYDDTGAIKEWACNMYEENNEHRHISHLYTAWPANETQNNEELVKACKQALENRNNAGKKSEETQTHGWLHKALVAAKLKNAELVDESLDVLLSNNVYYDSLMTDHNTNRGSDCYCTDTSLGIVGVIDEMLLYSNDGEIEALPALVSELPSGEIKGLMAKTCAEVSIKWDEKTAYVTVKSSKDQTIKISCKGKNEQSVDFKTNETKTIEFNF